MSSKSANWAVPAGVTAVVVVAVATAVLAYPPSRVAAVVINGTVLAVLTAGCLAAATWQPLRTF